jgi:hypothetical protein
MRSLPQRRGSSAGDGLEPELEPTAARLYASSRAYNLPAAMHTLRLTCSTFYVDLRLSEINGRWLASTDTPHGPSLGVGFTPHNALVLALRPFDGAIHELLRMPLRRSSTPTFRPVAPRPTRSKAGPKAGPCPLEP